jgi:hypothetical protein
VRFLLIFAGIFVVLTKLFDVLSTLKRIRHFSGETNPFVNRMMRIFGIRLTVWFVFGLVVAIMIYSLWVTFDTSLDFQIIYLVLCIFITVIQGAVAYSNWYGKLNPITNGVITIHQQINKLFKN